ncbi:hypothetical protein BKA62DRAFT_616099 [Auriculariales sp. MPI-PUGE-AT-0066]|nr:hypothetical protein BKA62DRAFT_616099 [Auriculariales sp. MPI-PUGE-AT-0066]
MHSRFTALYTLLIALALTNANPLQPRQDSTATTYTTSISSTDSVTTSATSSSSVTSTTTGTSGVPAKSPPAVKKPKGGIGFDAFPQYKAKSDFDWQSFYLGLHQELIELDIFRSAAANFTGDQLSEAGLTEEDRYLINFMADQEVGHATMLSNMISVDWQYIAQCTYSYPNSTVREWIDFSRLVTRYGEGGTIGFLGHLNSQEGASLINDAIQTEGRQQMIFRQWEGLFPMPFWFTTSITQSMQWTLLAPYIATCPADAPRIAWTAFPGLNITNNPSLLSNDSQPDITTNGTGTDANPGFQLQLSWDAPGKATGWNDSYSTATLAKGKPKWVAWISQLNTTYTPLENVSTNKDGSGNGTTVQPGDRVYGEGTAPLLNGTVYTLVTDANPYVTPYNLSTIEAHIVAGPALFNIA